LHELPPPDPDTRPAARHRRGGPDGPSAGPVDPERADWDEWSYCVGVVGIPDALYWQLTPRATAAWVQAHREADTTRTTRDREVIQWTAGVILEQLLPALRMRKITGGRFEPADFFALPTRAELLASSAAGSPADSLRVMAMFTLAKGGTLPDAVLEALQQEDAARGRPLDH